MKIRTFTDLTGYLTRKLTSAPTDIAVGYDGPQQPLVFVLFSQDGAAVARLSPETEPDIESLAVNIWEQCCGAWPAG